MKTKLLGILTIMTLATPFSWASLDSQGELLAPTSKISGQVENLPTGAGIYRITKNNPIFYRAAEDGRGSWQDADNEAFMTLSQNEPVYVEFLPSGEVALSMLPDTMDKSGLPNKILISKEEFEQAQLEFLEEGDLELMQDNYSRFEMYKEAARRHGRPQRARMRFGGYGGCLAYVCSKVGCSGKVGNGVGMTNYLRNRGWKPISCSNPKVGAVASWSGGSQGSGHTAIWNGKGWCYDLGCADPGRGYRLKNCVARQ